VSPQTTTVDAPAGVTGASPTLRIGFTVSRKVGNAVVRNRVRRRLRAAAEAIMPTHARQGFDYVVIGRRQSLTRPFPDLLQDLEVALRKVRAERGAEDHPSPQPAHRASRTSDKD
jgi:ribonuclease P protein component